jgi:hypothetical protein
MILSRSILRQILAMDLIESVIDGVGRANVELTGAMRRNADRALGRLKIERGRWWAEVVSGERLELCPKDYRKYRREIGALKAELARQYGEEVNAVEYLNAVLLWVEDVAQSVPRFPMGRRLAALRCIEALAALYKLYDPDFAAGEEIENGTALGEKFKQAVGVW